MLRSDLLAWGRDQNTEIISEKLMKGRMPISPTPCHAFNSIKWKNTFQKHTPLSRWDYISHGWVHIKTQVIFSVVWEKNTYLFHPEGIKFIKHVRNSYTQQMMSPLRNQLSESEGWVCKNIQRSRKSVRPVTERTVFSVNSVVLLSANVRSSLAESKRSIST